MGGWLQQSRRIHRERPHLRGVVDVVLGKMRDAAVIRGALEPSDRPGGLFFNGEAG
jgi:hypothetical protein